MKPNPLRANWELVRLTESALRLGTNGLGSLPGMLRQLLEEGAWQSFQLPSGEDVAHERFAEFAAAPPPRGLGASVEHVRQLIDKDPAALDLLDQATQNGAGRPPETLSIRQEKAPAGTTKDAALRRLRKDRPDLHTRVLEGELTPHAAMVQAGFRRRTATVPIGDPDRIAATLRRHLSPAALARLRDLLT